MAVSRVVLRRDSADLVLPTWAGALPTPGESGGWQDDRRWHPAILWEAVVAVRPVPRSSASAHAVAEPTVRLRAGQSFFQLLSSQGLLPDWLVASYAQADPDDRIALRTALQMLDDAVAMTGDPDLGLHGALWMSLDAPLLEYVTSSCATVRESLETFARYVMLVNDAVDVRLERAGERASLEFRSSMPMSRAAIDFGIASVHLARVRREPASLDREAEEVWFGYPEPVKRDVYREVFGPARLRFDAPLNCLVFPASWLELPLESADPKLHELLVRTVEEQVTDLASRQGLSQRVRALLRDRVPCGDSSAESIASRLGISRRTLSRRLEQEGMTFKILLDQTRCSLTLRYLLADRMHVGEIAAKLGFAEPASFYKAFRRWFGTTPSEYLHRRIDTTRH
jgi:AraC-like DNA-binding protein